MPNSVNPALIFQFACFGGICVSNCADAGSEYHDWVAQFSVRFSLRGLLLLVIRKFSNCTGSSRAVANPMIGNAVMRVSP